MARFNESYYSERYYGQNNGCLAIIVGGLAVWGFLAWVDYRTVNEPVRNAEECLRLAKQSPWPNKGEIKACEEDLAKQKAYVNSGRSEAALRARDREINKNSFTMGDVFWVCVAALGTMVFGWRTVRGVASPFEVLLALVSTGFAVILTLSIGIGAFVMLFVAGMLMVLMCRVLGDSFINQGRYVRDGYDEEFDVNERRAARQASRAARQSGQSGGSDDPLAHRRLPVSPEAQAAYEKRLREP